MKHVVLRSWSRARGVTPIDSIRLFPTGVKVTSRGQGDILGVVKQSTCNYGSGKVGLHMHSRSRRILGQGQAVNIEIRRSKFLTPVGNE